MIGSNNSNNDNNNDKLITESLFDWLGLRKIFLTKMIIDRKLVKLTIGYNHNYDNYNMLDNDI